MLSSFSHNFISNKENFKIFVYSQSAIIRVSQNLKVAGPLAGKFDFFGLSGFEIQRDFDYKVSKIKFYSIRALKQYLNEKDLIHVQVTTTISQNLVHRFLKCTLNNILF